MVLRRLEVNWEKREIHAVNGRYVRYGCGCGFGSALSILGAPLLACSLDLYVLGEENGSSVLALVMTFSPPHALSQTTPTRWLTSGCFRRTSPCPTASR